MGTKPWALFPWSHGSWPDGSLGWSLWERSSVSPLRGFKLQVVYRYRNSWFQVGKLRWDLRASSLFFRGGWGGRATQTLLRLSRSQTKTGGSNAQKTPEFLTTHHTSVLFPTLKKESPSTEPKTAGGNREIQILLGLCQGNPVKTNSSTGSEKCQLCLVSR